MSSHRTVEALQAHLPFAMASPFSNFHFIEQNFGDQPSIRRVFSQARSYGCQTLLIETIPTIGILKEDDKELSDLFPDFQPSPVQRLSFWNTKIEHIRETENIDSSNLLGFAILKNDRVDSRNVNGWYVFESVLIKYPHRHNCVHGAKAFSVRIGHRLFEIEGVLYCQQNTLNKTCAQVALRSLLATAAPDKELSYRQINLWASEVTPFFKPWNGLQVQEIRQVLKRSERPYFDIVYNSGQEAPPYQKLVYAGIESGMGALLGFKLSGPGLTNNVSHIIPFFGHTFNQDTWVPHAESAYFHVGENTRYLPSETWMSSFIGHDDNFGSNFCVPRRYVPAKHATYAVELLQDDCEYSGTIAEAIAVDYLYSICPNLDEVNLPWLQRLVDYVEDQKVVLRAICISADQYIRHGEAMIDWDGNQEDPELYKILQPCLPHRLWLVEVSVPELFPANLHKIGEVVLDATAKADPEKSFSLFVCARIPGRFLLPDLADSEEPSFILINSNLQSHTLLYGCSESDSMAI